MTLYNNLNKKSFSKYDELAYDKSYYASYKEAVDMLTGRNLIREMYGLDKLSMGNKMLTHYEIITDVVEDFEIVKVFIELPNTHIPSLRVSLLDDVLTVKSQKISYKDGEPKEVINLQIPMPSKPYSNDKNHYSMIYKDGVVIVEFEIPIKKPLEIELHK